MYPNLRKYLLFVLNPFSSSRGSTSAENGATGICTAHAIQSPTLSFFYLFFPRLTWLLLSKIVTQIHATAILVGTASACVPVLQLMPTSAASKEHQFTGDLLPSVVCTWASLTLEVIFEASLAFCCPIMQIWQKQVDNKCPSSPFSSCLCVSS